jgi:hypothetical protein
MSAMQDLHKPDPPYSDLNVILTTSPLDIG